MGESLKHLLQGIEQISQQVTAQVRDVVRVGLFEALIDLSTDMTWLNYAVPIAPLGTNFNWIVIWSHAALSGFAIELYRRNGERFQVIYWERIL
ncbi:MAG TPA: hypothetical protein V6C85_08225 [Allocoleopsis sp.]